MPITTVFVRSYVGPQQHESSQLAAGRNAPSRNIFGQILKQAISSLHPVALRRESASLFVLEMVVLGGLGLIATLWLAGTDAVIWRGLALADVSLAAVVFLAGFSAASKRHRCEHDCLCAAKACQPLAYRFAGYQAPAFDDGRHGDVETEGMHGFAGDIELEAVPADHLLAGDIILVECGQRIPADGTILEGVALVDESIITGQSDPAIRESSLVSYVMRDTEVVAGRIIVEVAPQRGHPLDWQAEDVFSAVRA